MQCSLGLVIWVVIMFTHVNLLILISDVSVNTNILTANNNNVKHLSNICQHLSNVIKECCDIRDNKLILVNFGTENIKEIINMICTESELGSGLDQFRTGPDSDLGLDINI